MKPDKKFLSYVNLKRAFAGTLIPVLAMQVLLFSSFVPVDHSGETGVVKAGWLTPSTSAMECFASYKDGGDPNSDLHVTSRKQTKVKCAKKLMPGTPQAGRTNDASDDSHHIVAGFSAVKRPAYYVFLFRYTLF